MTQVTAKQIEVYATCDDILEKELLLSEEQLLVYIGRIAGECYNSSKDANKCMLRAINCIKRGHHSPWEHYNVSLTSIVDRGVSHALVRHRHCAAQQSSTIYQKYGSIDIIESPVKDTMDGKPVHQFTEDDMFFFASCHAKYQELLDKGCPPSKARDVLPTCLATNLVITTNIRQWMYMIFRREGPGDSANMHEWSKKVREWFGKRYPYVLATFDLWYIDHPL